MHKTGSELLPSQTNKSTDKLLNVLEVMASQSKSLRLLDIAQLCKMNPSTTLRFITALLQRNYVAQDPETGMYYLTFKLCSLAQGVSMNLDLCNVAQPYMENISAVFGESCNLVVENDMAVMYVHVVKGSNKVIMSTQHIGHVAPLHCTGVGKLFLTDYLPVELERLVVMKKLTKYTENTITDPSILKSEIDKIRELGYAFDNEECEVGARCIAAPIRDYTGKVKAGISVSGPVSRMTDEHIFNHLPILLEAANRISVRLGWLKNDTKII